MARRRMLSDNMLYDPDFNQMSESAQLLFVRMLVKTDDYGIVPADHWSMFNLSKKMQGRLDSLLAEIENAGLLRGFLYEARPYFCFKRDRFDEYQSYLIQKRTRSEYLRMDRKEMEGTTFQEILGKSWKFQKVLPLTNREYKVESRKTKDKDTVARFEEIWGRFPRKEKKREAEIHFFATVKSEEDWVRINRGLDKYLVHLKMNGTEAKYIQQGSTWFNNWQDWPDFVEPSQQQETLKEKAQRVAREQEERIGAR